MTTKTIDGIPKYSPEEEEYILRNKAGVPVGTKPHEKWTPLKVAIWVGVALLGGLGWTMLAIVRGEEVNTIWFVVASVCTYAMGYRFYALYIQRSIMRPNDRSATPAERINNGRDFEPTNRVVLYGHHFAAIAGAGPLVGPVLASQMGYLPGTLWIIFGVLVAGAVQDMLVLFFSMRRDGRSLGQMAVDEIGKIGGTIATIIVFFMLMIVLAVLAMICVNALAESPWGVFAVGMTIPIALTMGIWLRFVQPGKIGPVSLVGFLALMACIIGGRWVAQSPLGDSLHLSPTTLVWAIVIYGFLAAVLPVWLLLTPRDYLSTFMKVGTIVVLALGIILVRPIVQMPAVTEFATNTAGPVFAGTLFPFLFITIACGALSGMHSMVASGTTPKMIQKESQARMLGYGGMLMESFVAAMALAAAVSLNQGVYFGMNMSKATIDGLAGTKVAVTAGVTPREVAEAAEIAISKMGVTDTKGQQITAVWESHDADGNPATYRGADAYMKVAEDVGEPSIVSRTGGAPTLAVGLANILRNLGGGPGMMGFWYHFAIMFEALFILSAVDAVTRVARFQLSDALGNLIPKFKDPSWLPGSLVSTAVVVSAWGSVLLMGVTDPRGGINTLWPLFGIANQLIAAVALTVCTVVVVRKGLVKWVWIPLIPLAFDTAVTFTASFQKIFSTDKAIGYWQQWRNANAALPKLTDPVQIQNTEAVIRNTFIQGTLSIVFVVCVALIMLFAALRVYVTLKNNDTKTSEDPFQESNLYAPTGMIPSALESKLIKEYAIVGDPNLMHASKPASRRTSRERTTTADS